MLSLGAVERHHSRNHSPTARQSTAEVATVVPPKIGRRRRPPNSERTRLYPPISEPISANLTQRRADEVFRAEALRRVPLLEWLNLLTSCA